MKRTAVDTQTERQTLNQKKSFKTDLLEGTFENSWTAPVDTGEMRRTPTPIA